MILWDATGTWKGMPERIEQEVYGGLTVEDMERIEDSTPTTFAGPEQAIAWGWEQGCFRDAVHAQNAYNEVKTNAQPKSAAEMFTAWIQEVQKRKAEKASESEMEMA
jgi:hypothetical protein